MSANSYMFLCEKPSQVKILSKLLSNTKSEGRAVVGEYKGKKIVLFPLSGHVMGIPYPNEYIDKFKDKSYAETLQFLPVMPKDFNDGKDTWFYKKVPTNEKIYKQFLAKAKNIDKFVLATDPDNEGASLGVEVLLSRNLTKNLIAYMDMSNLESMDLLKKNFEQALNGKGKLDWKTMAYLGFIRKDLDYGIGVNTTRLLQIVLNSKKSFGTQQTRLLNEITKRYLDFINHKKKYFYKVAINTKYGKFYAIIGKENKDGKETPILQTEDKEVAEKVANMLRRAVGNVKNVENKKQNKKSPKWYDGSDIAVEAGKILKVSPTKLMSEKHGVLEEMYLKGIMTYPRGDSKGMMPLSQFDLQREIVQGLFDVMRKKGINTTRIDLSLQKKHLWYEDGKIQVNHTPFTIAASDVKNKLEKLNKEEEVVFDLALKRLASVFYPDAIELKKTITMLANGVEAVLTEISDVDLGYKEIYGEKKRESKIPDSLTKGSRIDIESVEVEKVETKPQPLYTIETLIPMMKRKNIGTQATYEQLVAAITDKEKGFVKINKGKLIPTEFTIKFLEIIPDWAIHVLDEYEEHISEDFANKKLSMQEALKRKNEIIIRVFNAVKESVEKHKEELMCIDPTSFENKRKEKKEKDTGIKCPKCGGEIIEREKYLQCSNKKLEKKDGKWCDTGTCDFILFKQQKMGSVSFKISSKILKNLLQFEKVEVEAVSSKMKKKKYKQKIKMSDETYRIELIFE